MELSSLGFPTLPGAGASAIAGGQLSDNFDTFLTLLTSQLKNQDPLEPMKSEQFTQQLVQFSQVEQQITTNDNLESLLSLSLANQQGTLVNFIGKTVDGVGEQAVLSDGNAEWSFELDDVPASVSLLITDSSGRAVFADKMEGEEGLNSYVWDGRDNNGEELPEGTYRLSVAAVDADDNSIGATIRAKGVVEGVEIVDGVARLIVGGNIVPLNQVTSVTDVAAEG